MNLMKLGTNQGNLIFTSTNLSCLLSESFVQYPWVMHPSERLTTVAAEPEVGLSLI